MEKFDIPPAAVEQPELKRGMRIESLNSVDTENEFEQYELNGVIYTAYRAAEASKELEGRDPKELIMIGSPVADIEVRMVSDWESDQSSRSDVGGDHFRVLIASQPQIQSD